MASGKSLPHSRPESAGIPAGALLCMMEELKKLDSLNSIMVLRHGHVCMEGWWTPYAPEIPHILFSISKSFTSAAIGIAQEQGLLKITDRLISFFPEYDSIVTDRKMRDVTLRHLLTMSSGHSCCARPYMLANPDGDWIAGFLSSPLDYEPGTRFVYNSAATYMLSAVIRKVTGINVRDYLMPRLFEPLGIEPGIWECCPRGINTGGWGLYLKTEDIAKFAQLLLNGGVWEKRQIIPADYLHEATSRQIDNSANEWPDWKQGYGYQFWRSLHGFRADGASGQYALVIPEKDMAVAVTSGVSDMQKILEIIWEILLPAVKDEVLPENKTDADKLARMLKNLRIPVAAGDLMRRRASSSWRFRKNQAGIISAAVSFMENKCCLEFQTSGGCEKITAGFGFNCDNKLQLNDHMKRKAAASAAWISEDVLEVHICCYEASFREIIRVDFTSADKPLTAECRFSTFRSSFLPELIAVTT